MIISTSFEVLVPRQADFIDAQDTVQRWQDARSIGRMPREWFEGFEQIADDLPQVKLVDTALVRDRGQKIANAIIDLTAVGTFSLRGVYADASYGLLHTNTEKERTNLGRHLPDLCRITNRYPARLMNIIGRTYGLEVLLPDGMAARSTTLSMLSEPKMGYLKLPTAIFNSLYAHSQKHVAVD